MTTLDNLIKSIRAWVDYDSAIENNSQAQWPRCFSSVKQFSDEFEWLSTRGNIGDDWVMKYPTAEMITEWHIRDPEVLLLFAIRFGASIASSPRPT